MRLFLCIARLLLSQMLNGPGRAAADTIDSTQMLTDTFGRDSALEAALDHRRQQGGRPRWAAQAKGTGRLEHRVPQKQLDRRRDLRRTSRAWGFQQSRATASLKAMQPAAHRVTALPANPGNLCHAVPVMEQQDHLSPPAQSWTLSSIVQCSQMP
jgi:hypothetical protein